VPRQWPMFIVSCLVCSRSHTLTGCAQARQTCTCGEKTADGRRQQFVRQSIRCGASVDAIRGLKDATHVEDVEALLRAEYVAALTEYLSAKLVQETASRQISP
jgi:hypothetical protein